MQDSVLLEVEEVGMDAIPVANPDTILRGESSQLNILGSIPYDYLWSPSETLSQNDIANPVATPMETTIYSVEIKTEKGCTVERGVQVVVITECVDHLFFPNAFTPNNDGTNDVLYLRGAFVEDMYFAIYNRWGEVIWESHDDSVGWDGTYGGRLVPDGTYSWVIEFKTSETDERKIISGHVNILK